MTASQPMRQLRIGWLHRQWFMFGQMAKMPVPQHIIDSWLEAALADRAVPRDLVKYCRTRFDKPDLEPEQTGQ